MDNENTDESFADKAKAQIDAFKTKEGRNALKEKVKESVESIRRSGFVQAVMSKIKGEFANVKVWCSVNWAAGRYGKFRVMLLLILLLLACKGLFSGWGSSSEVELAKIQKEREETAAAASFLGALFSGGSDNSNGPSSRSAQPETMPIWTCRKCGKQLQSKWPPSTQIRCRAWSGRNDGTQNCQFSRSN